MKNGDFPLLCEFTVEVSLFLDSTGGSLNPAARTGAFERRTKQAYHLELTSRQALVVSQDTFPWDGRQIQYGYGSIPINTIFRGMNIHKSQLFWGSPGVQGFDPSPYETIGF